MLRAPCQEAEECLGGDDFCMNPHRCDCEGDDCLIGVCDPIAKDDGSICTRANCNAATKSFSHEPDEDFEGESCGSTPEGAEMFCGQGLCKVPECGDYVVDSVLEECDQGAANSDITPNACRTNCMKPSCGDGVVDSGPAFGVIYGEECDDGAGNVDVPNEASNDATLAEACRGSVTLEDGTGTTLHCVLPFCGDGVLNGGERCDDHDSVNGDGCNPTCSMLGSVSLVAGERGGEGDRDGPAGTGRLRAPLALAIDGSSAYLTSSNGTVIRKLDVNDGSLETLAGLPQNFGSLDGIGSAARFSLPHGLAVIGNHLYVADSTAHTIRRIDLSTAQVDTVAGDGLSGFGSPAQDDGVGTAASLTFPRVLVARNSNELLFVESQADCRLRWFNLTTEEVKTLIDPSLCTSSGDNMGTLIDGAAMAPNGHLYLSDRNRILEISFIDGANPAVDPPTANLSVIAGTDNPNGGYFDAVGTSALFRDPAGLAVAGNNLYIADQNNHVIRKMVLTTAAVSTISTDPLDQPLAIAVDGNTLLVAERLGSVIYKGTLSLNSATLSTLAGVADNGGTADDSNGDAVQDARFFRPRGLTMLDTDPDTLYIADNNAGLLRTVDLSSATPAVSTLNNNATGKGELAALTSLGSRLFGLFNISANYQLYEMDANGQEAGISGTFITDNEALSGAAIVGNYAYVAIKDAQSIIRVDLQNGANEVFSGKDNTLAVIDGSVHDARFGAPVGIVACGGNLYVSETASGSFQSHVIRKIDLSANPPMVSTIAGFVSDRGYVDGFGLGTRFHYPEGLACDERDPNNLILYVADSANHVLRQIDLKSLRVSTLVGTPYFAGALDGVGLDAGLNRPKGIFFDPASGDLFITDQFEHIIRQVQ